MSWDLNYRDECVQKLENLVQETAQAAKKHDNKQVAVLCGDMLKTMQELKVKLSRFEEDVLKPLFEMERDRGLKKA